MDADQDELIRIYSKVSAMLRNMAQTSDVSVERGREFDALVERASVDLKTDLSEFRIGNAYLTSNGRYHQLRPIRGRVESFAGYIAAYLSDPVKGRIGFAHGATE